jgi:DNA-binding CsgD family transcriptional regulator
MRSRDLTPMQLEIVMHLANGMRMREIATAVHRSRSLVYQQCDSARVKVGAKTLPQLVSIVIASGQLEWSDEKRRVNGARPADNG